MYKFPIGAMLDSFRMETREAVKAAAAIGVQGLQMYATKGENAPENLTGEKRKDLLRFVKDNGLVFSAICGDLGKAFIYRERNIELIDKSKRIMELAKELETDVVTTHIGVIPADKNSEKYGVMLSALRACGEYAAARGVTLAIETGPEVAPVLNDFVIAAGEGVGVNLDPANFVMVTGQDPAEAVRLIGKKIVHTHVKDGVRLKESDPVLIYKSFAEGGIEALDVADYFLEVPVGEGSVNWDEYIGALREVGFDGYLTIERECGDTPAADIKKAADFIRAGGYLG